ncbi:glutamate synthase subunit beta [Flavobacteriaceae bacterium]|nr:glutamate synthase subunit beta [Flavobacteriaceae bacterium]
MGKITGFLEFDRQTESNITPEKRKESFEEFTERMSDQELTTQGSRCMDCGIPFCHGGCPLGNLIPDFNHMVHQGEWQKAAWLLQSTNNFPEFTGRLCPAPCEKACVLGINSDPVAIETIEKNIIEKAFENGWVNPQPPTSRSGKIVAVVGSGPAGLAAAQQLNRAGHHVTVYEKADAIGGLLRYGIPNFKLEKQLIDRRIDVLKQEGIRFVLNTEVGKDLLKKDLDQFDAIVLCGGSEIKRTLPQLEGVSGVHQAMDYLTEQTKNLFDPNEKINIHAKGKNVIVIGGGDTGSDCVGTANRQGAASVTNFEIMPKPPKERSPQTPWPYWPLQLKTSSSHEEGCERDWLINTKEAILDEDGNLKALKTVKVNWEFKEGRYQLEEVENSEQIWPCEQVFLALGFTGPHQTIAKMLDIPLDPRGNYQTENYRVKYSNIFVAGDMRRGQSLIVWAISEGREAAKAVDKYLEHQSFLSTKGEGDLLRA